MAVVIEDGVIRIRARDETAQGVADARRSVSGIRESIRVDADIQDVRRRAREAEALLSRLRGEVNVDSSELTAAQRRVAQLRAELSALTRLRQRVDVAVNTESGRQNLARLARQSEDTGRSLRAIHGALGGLNFGQAVRGIAIFSGLASAAGAAGAAIAAIPAAGASLGGIIGVLAGSFSGVGDALKGYKADQDAATASGHKGAGAALSNARAIRDATTAVNNARQNAARVAEDGAERIADAEETAARTARDGARAVADAKAQQSETARRGAEAIEDASDRVTDAMRAETRARDDLNDAYRDAAQAMDDLRERVSDYALDQEGAAIRVIEAEAQLRTVNENAESTALDRRKAEYELAVAKERVSDITREQRADTEKLAAAERDGLSGSEQVISAQERLDDAMRGTQSAREDLAGVIRDTERANREAADATARAQMDAAEANQDAAEAVAQAQEDAAQANADAAQQVQDALQGVEDAMASQAAAAADAAGANSKFADAMAKLSPAGREFVNQLLRMQPLLRGLRDTAQESFLPGLTQMLRDSETLFPIFNGFIRDTGTIMGNSAREMGRLFRSEDFQNNLTKLLNNSLPITQSLGDMMVDLTDRVVQFGAEMGPASDGFATFLDSLTSGFDGLFDELTPHADSFKRIWEALGRILEVLLPLIGELVGWLADHLAPILEDVAGWLERNKDSLSTWAGAIAGAVLVIKTLNIAAQVTRWCQGIASAIGIIGAAAKTEGGKVGTFADKLGKLKTIGKIGITFAATYVGFELISGLMDGGAGKARTDLNKDGSLDTGERGAAIGSGDISGIGSGIADDLKRGWGASGQAFGRGDWYEGILASLYNPEMAAKISAGWEGIGITIGQKWRSIKDTATSSAAELAGNVSGWWGRTFTNSDSTFANIKNSVGNNMMGAKNWATERAGSLWSGVSGWWGRTFTDSDSTFSRVRNTIGDRMQGARNWATERAGGLWSGVSGWWGRTFTDSDSTFSRVRNTIGDRMQGARNFAVERASSLWSGVSNWWGRTFTDSNSTFSRIRNAVGDFMRGARDNAVNWARSAWDGVTGWFRRMWDGLRDMGRTGVNGVIRALNWLSDKANVVLRFLRVPVIPGIAYMEQGGQLGARPQMLARGGAIGGGFMTNGPQAIVGEGDPNHPEYVIPTDPRYRDRARALFGALAGDLGVKSGQSMPMLEGGGILGWLGGAASNVWGGISNFASSVGNKLTDAMSWIGGTVGNIGSEVLNAVRGMLPGEPWGGMGGALAGKAFDGIRKKIEDSFMTSADPGGAGVQRWAPLVLRALSMMGQPASLLNIVLRRMAQESGGNPRAINNWDINAKRGTPSMGLMQTIMPTFRAYHFPGTSFDPYDPLANILASMRYAMARYGSLPAAYNRAGGYAEGGTIPGNGTLDRVPIMATPGERVLTTSQNAAFERLVAALDSRGGTTGPGGFNPDNVVVNIAQVASSPAETGRMVALGLRQVS